MRNHKYKLVDDGRRLPSGSPLYAEYYEPSWEIAPSERNDRLPSVIVTDPGDGSGIALANKLVEFLNSDEAFHALI